MFLIKWTSRNGKAKTSREQNVVLKPSLDKDQQLPAETRGYDSSSPLVREGRHNEALEAILRKPQDKITLPDYNFLFETYVQLGDFIRAGLILSTITRIIAGKHPVERFQGRLVLKENRARAGNPPAGSLHDTYLALARMVRGKEHADWAAQLSQLAVDCLVTTLSIRDNPRAYYDLALAFEKDGENNSALELYQIFDETGRHYFDVAERYKKLKTRIKDGPAHPAKAPQAREFAPAQAAFKTGVAVAGVVLNSRYELRAQLGEGGMGVIYEGLDRQTGQPVAVKRMHTYLKEYPEEYARFRREAQIVGQLRHPNIIRIHELLEQAGEIYLVFEYVSGKTLQDFLKEKKRFQLDECKNIFNGVCDAVHYAHKSGVIHRDLKPANIMLNNANKALVMDFGLASQLNEGYTRVTHKTTSGTRPYMAPEQYEGTVKRESDIYAMGICLYEMLTGALPFEGYDNLKQKKRKDYREVTTIVSWLPPGVDSVISRALEPEPTMRYADALDFWAALKDL